MKDTFSVFTTLARIDMTVDNYLFQIVRQCKITKSRELLLEVTGLGTEQFKDQFSAKLEDIKTLHEPTSQIRAGVIMNLTNKEVKYTSIPKHIWQYVQEQLE